VSYVEPVLSFVILLLVLGVVCPRRWERLRNRLVAFAALVLFLWSWPVTVKLTSATLECWYRPRALPAGDAEAIVVLSAGAFVPEPDVAGPVAGEHTCLRTRHAAWLYQRWKQVPIVVSGGKIAGPRAGTATLAEVMKRILVSEGVPPEMVWMETSSSSTYTNALYSARLLRQRGIRRIALVTEAYHMARAERAFRKQELEVVPAPCGFRSTDWRLRAPDFFPDSKAIDENADCLHEWAGLVWYGLSGKM